jgi:hypothetical protein
LLAAPRDRTDLLIVAATLLLAVDTLYAIAIDLRYWPPSMSGLPNARLGLGLLAAGLWALFSVQAPRARGLEGTPADAVRTVGRAGAAVFLLWTLSVEDWFRQTIRRLSARCSRFAKLLFPERGRK